MEASSPAELLTVLVRLHASLEEATFPLEAGDAVAARRERNALIQQLEDYAIPRLLQIDAPLLVVVGGSTGAGKSTLVNSLVGRPVTVPGVLRPTTRSPVLVHHPADARWFGQDRLLPDLVRIDHLTDDRRALQLVAAEEIPEGMAIVDAPDVDSVEEENRLLAAQLLSAADLWLFVTSAARYSDQVPWEFLKDAEQRSTAVAVVLDRTTPRSVREVSSHLARMLTAKGLGSSPLFTVAESPLDEQGMLPPAVVAPIRDWLDRLAADSAVRMVVVRKTLNGTIRALTPRVHEVADAQRTQVDAANQLRTDAEQAYDEALDRADTALRDGTLLRGEVLARWQDFVAAGELVKSLEDRVTRLRDRLVNAARGQPTNVQQLTTAVHAALETVVREHAESAAERAAQAWRSLPAGRWLLDHAPHRLGRVSPNFAAETAQSVQEWQNNVVDLVRREGSERRAAARLVTYGANGLGLALMTVVFVGDAAPAGDVRTTRGTAVADGRTVAGQRILEAVFGAEAVHQLAAEAHQDLSARVQRLFNRELRRYLDELDAHDVGPQTSASLHDLAFEVDEARVVGAPA
jgi:energy-coupling factor transporter ATP-binding protein EcfA2